MQKQLATKIDESVKNALDSICETRGIKLGHFVQEAILDKIEELEDIEDLKHLRGEEFVSLNDATKELKKLGKL